MNQFVLVAALFGFVACGRLDSTQYLPPNQKYNQGGQNAGGQYQGSAAAGPAGGYSGANQYQSAGGKSFERGPNADIPILRLDQQNEGDGNFQYAFETGNGIQATQQGNAQEGAGTQSQGSYSYTSPEGEQIQINYSAGEGGFQAQGSHIPTAPPVPAEIAKAIEQNLADEARGIVDDGQYKPEYQNEGNYQGGIQQKNQYQGGAAQSNQYIPPNAAGNAGYKY
ncbi:pupal cuticle protein 20-like [Anthonomus grandis grandis]|uniref:pupal cuticle protein 20-like n=1 Tax=Anthonomus grandis grandis TaxID=2921223 RepID=UPI00216514CE|nr:pupal cuticle protein 20-like [Anthonomus grandis grandis]